MNKENNIPKVTYVSSSSIYDYQSDQDKKFPKANTWVSSIV